MRHTLIGLASAAALALGAGAASAQYYPGPQYAPPSGGYSGGYAAPGFGHTPGIMPGFSYNAPRSGLDRFYFSPVPAYGNHWRPHHHGHHGHGHRGHGHGHGHAHGHHHR